MDSSPRKFNADDTKEIQGEVRALFAEMSHEFRETLMHSFLWTAETLDQYLSRDLQLEGDMLKDAYSHLESVLARIEGYACEKSTKDFPTYEQWVASEYEAYKSSLSEGKEDIERLIGEGGVVAPGKTSPVDTMEDDTLAHYNFLHAEFKKTEKRSIEATALLTSPHFLALQKQAMKMCKAILATAHR
tara:strand:- start:872 stop:1435 length:564 start_codon:yes stop_codon:yes gene_type:complete